MKTPSVAEHEHLASLVLEAVCRLGTDEQFTPHSAAIILSRWADQSYLMAGKRNTAHIAMLYDIARALDGRL